MIDNSKYLVEQTLIEYLHLIFPNIDDWTHNKKFKDTRFRPDYLSESLKLIVEFDGYQHYQNPYVIARDTYKNELYENAGYTIIRIPHFIQMETNSIKYFFNKDVELPMGYKHGFRLSGAKCFPPSMMTELGIIAFLETLEKLKVSEEGRFIRRHIISSLKEHIFKGEPEELIMTLSTQHLFTEVLYEDRKLLHSLIGNDYDDIGSFRKIDSSKLPEGFNVKPEYDGEVDSLVLPFDADYALLQKLFDLGFIEDNNKLGWSYVPTNIEHLEFMKEHNGASAFCMVNWEKDKPMNVVCSGICITTKDINERQAFIDRWSEHAVKNGIYENDDTLSIAWR